ncbi:FMN-dependent NADH-azoreductase [Erythrobacter sp. HL-111]|uniref:FMN-dependent NADH-azoreductase n=1 Tax=Erythrobacter sp. HL-111 TaxID=1798193 RepID=UPI0006DB5593|nr:NAD(P)H-dependent oxidoreductase [Erythrobacter sp. HL-111]KPP86922.1 MAG: FMN-dependent NADH-azoreductase [Erythrobacteraceae bacterium HL-111]SDS18583.1 FMN-dependent NADH-azoreductase [Erythrobacter sp. HL-111]
MTTILHIKASIRGEESVSNALGQRIVDGLTRTGEADVVVRDLAEDALPFVSAERFAANLAPEGERTPEQAELAGIADTLIAELEAADIIVLSTPVYNFGVPASLKAWADLVARAGRTFKYTENGPVGLVEGKKAYVAAASGGTKIGSEIDFMSPWLTFFLGFLGITDIKIVAADGIMGEDGEAIIEAAHIEAQRLAA